MVQVLVAVGVIAAIVLIYALLLPWLTYSRALLFVAAMIFAGSFMTFYIAWVSRGADAMRARNLFWQGVGILVIGIMWALFCRFF